MDPRIARQFQMPRRIAALVLRANLWGARLMEACHAYAPAWSFLPGPEDMDGWGPLLSMPLPDGLIRRALPPTILELERSLSCPVVVIGDDGQGRSRVEVDQRSLGRLAARHVAELGHDRVAMLGFGFSEARWTEREAGIAEIFPGELPRHTFTGMEALWEWVRQLPRPIVIIGLNDVLARWALESCRLHRVSVPEEIQVVGIDNDPFAVHAGVPSLSSVDLNFGTLAEAALTNLARQLAGLPVPEAMSSFPGPVIPRDSTAVAAIRPPLATALDRLHRQARFDLRVSELAESAGVTPRTLQRQFKARFGVTPLEAIRQERLEEACRRLRTTQESIADIAEACGFANPRRFATVFRQVLGLSPRAWRQRHR